MYHCYITDVQFKWEQQGVQLCLDLPLLQGMNTLDDKETYLGTSLFDQDGDATQTFELPVSITLCNKHKY